MLESFVLRLVPSSLGAGGIVGEIEHVASGRVAGVADAGELLRFLVACAPGRPAPAPGSGAG